MKENWQINWEDYYQILGIDHLSDNNDIKRAYDYKKWILHPDRMTGIPEPARQQAEQEFAKVNYAYDVLKDPIKRQEYDAEWLKRTSKWDDIKYNQKGKAHSNPITRSHSPEPEKEQCSNVTQDFIHSVYCEKCKGKTNMLIAFIDKKPKYGTCPICNTFWDLTGYFNSQAKPNVNQQTGAYPKQEHMLTLDEKIDRMLDFLSHDKNRHFTIGEWVTKEKEVKEELKSYGGASRLEECPICKLKTLLLNSSATAGRCITPDCFYWI
jgi:DnaJ-class molecular chaperone